jgi:two-component system sensor histidine kinase/response regulator
VSPTGSGPAASAPAASPSPGAAPGADPDRASILLVDDQDVNLRLLEAILRGRDETLVKARSGPEALRALLERDFAVVLLDVQMPGMDGFETAQLVRERERSRHTPILFVTAIDRDAEHVRRGYLLGAVDYLFKPLDPDVLRAKVGAFVELWRMRQAERRAKEALAERSRELERSNADLAQFGQIVAHDLQAPLRTVAGYLDLLVRRSGDAIDEKGRHYVARAKDDLERMHVLIRDLLSYARARTEPPELEATDADAVARQVLQSLSSPLQEAGAQVVVDPLPRVTADPTQLAQVFQNLVDNAVKFRSKEPPQVRISAERRAGAWVFRVVDNGIGIDPKDHDRIFEPCTRLHARDDYPGTGLGLAICRKVVESHGGDIGVESAKGRGSTFWFSLPARFDS